MKNITLISISVISMLLLSGCAASKEEICKEYIDRNLTVVGQDVYIPTSVNFSMPQKKSLKEVCVVDETSNIEDVLDCYFKRKAVNNQYTMDLEHTLKSLKK